MSLPMHLRSYREKSKDELARDFFNAPLPEQMPGPNEPPSVVKIRGRRDVEGNRGGMEINAVLSVEGKEEVYVSDPYPPCQVGSVGPDDGDGNRW
jgi:hypothetical protein